MLSMIQTEIVCVPRDRGTTERKKRFSQSHLHSLNTQIIHTCAKSTVFHTKRSSSVSDLLVVVPTE